ncbi:MAG: M42 family peptidase [Thermotoga sp.]|nr:M42 family metallopeptidase [Thermotogota bacterium]RKX52950.1 MAG: M42 family peptidase [Thermotoga sp.]
MKDLIKKLTGIFSPSGREERIREAILGEVKPYVDEYEVDKLGNLIVHKKGRGKKILLDAHMDEVGFVVTYIDDKGFLRIEPVGGVNPLTLLYKRVQFESGTIGTVGIEGKTAKELKENYKNVTFDNIYVDIGVTSRKQAENKVKRGMFGGYMTEFAVLGDRLVAKSMDDRIGCAIIIQTLKELDMSPNDIYAVFAIQEEVGLIGATVSAYGIEPDMGIALDVTGWGDTPGGMKRVAMTLGKGPAIKVKDHYMIASKTVVDLLVKTAEESKIPYQMEVLVYGGTDGAMIQRTKKGVPTGVISIPCRYVHTQSEIVDYNDVLNTVKLLRSVLKKEV